MSNENQKNESNGPVAAVFLLRAKEFLSGAVELSESKNRDRAPGQWRSLNYFQFAHAAELALKAFIRLKSGSAPRGHSLIKLYYEAIRSGGGELESMSHLEQLLDLLDQGNNDAGFRYQIKSNSLADPKWVKEEISALVKWSEDAIIVSDGPDALKPGPPASIKFMFSKPQPKPGFE